MFWTVFFHSFLCVHVHRSVLLGLISFIFNEAVLALLIFKILNS